ncbi:unnamed protein product [Timema podura]|uniref:J domain-containing protein n=1 Tax=Timema podura TaxID=61482 RepID=A0ABN7PJT3_TIMPD|nr:unnamed protein product [Timema podura]
MSTGLCFILTMTPYISLETVLLKIFGSHSSNSQKRPTTRRAKLAPKSGSRILTCRECYARFRTLQASMLPHILGCATQESCWHPDKNSGDPKTHARFVKLNEAYSILSRPDKRKEYDLTLPRLEKVDGIYTTAPRGRV